MNEVTLVPRVAGPAAVGTSRTRADRAGKPTVGGGSDMGLTHRDTAP